MRTSAPSRATSRTCQRAASAEGVRSREADGRQAAFAEQDRGDVGDDAVRETLVDERAVEPAAALDHGLEHAVALGQHREQRRRGRPRGPRTRLEHLDLRARGLPGVDGRRRRPLGRDRRASARGSSRTTGRRPGPARRASSSTRSGWRAIEVIQVADREARPIRPRGAGADDDRLGLGAQPVGVGAGLDAGDPLRAAVGSRGPPVEAHRGLEQRERAAGRALVQVRRERLRDRVRADTVHDLDPAARSRLDPVPRTRGSGSSNAITTPADARVDERLRARRRVAVVVAGLERDVRGRTTSAVPGVAQRRDLGVQPTRVRTGRARADDLAVAHDHAPDPRVRRASRSGRARPGPRPSPSARRPVRRARHTSDPGVQPTADRHARGMPDESSPSPIRTVTVGSRISLDRPPAGCRRFAGSPRGGYRRFGTFTRTPRTWFSWVHRPLRTGLGSLDSLVKIPPPDQNWNTFLF